MDTSSVALDRISPPLQRIMIGIVSPCRRFIRASKATAERGSQAAPCTHIVRHAESSLHNPLTAGSASTAAVVRRSWMATMESILALRDDQSSQADRATYSAAAILDRFVRIQRMRERACATGAFACVRLRFLCLTDWAGRIARYLYVRIIRRKSIWTIPRFSSPERGGRVYGRDTRYGPNKGDGDDVYTERAAADVWTWVDADVSGSEMTDRQSIEPDGGGRSAGHGVPAAGEARVTDVGSPVHTIPGDEARKPEDGLALCLSGGGYRAMVFHVGVLWRLNEAKLLSKIDRVSSVSGGSITAGVLAMNWAKLRFRGDVAADFGDLLVAPIRRMASTRVDVAAVTTGLLLPGISISSQVAKAYRRHLFGKTSLQALPDRPDFVFNATNLESGALLRFSKPYLADYRVGRIFEPDIPIATAVAASSAFPPFLSPATLDLEDERWVTEENNDLTSADYRGEIRVTDGGVYDNLGLETAWKRYCSVIVSDGGGHMGADPTPPADWAFQLKRVLDVVDNQVRSLRKRQVIDSLIKGLRTGMYVGIRSHIADYPVSLLGADPRQVERLASTGTRLDALPDDLQEELVNWGYVVCDAGLRSHMSDKLRDISTTELPYPDRPLVQHPIG